MLSYCAKGACIFVNFDKTVKKSFLMEDQCLAVLICFFERFKINSITINAIFSSYMNTFLVTYPIPF